MRSSFLLLFVCFFCTRSYALTWDEPWADLVMKKATSFVLAKVVSGDDDIVKISIIKTLGGKEVKDSVQIAGFYLLDICSSSGHGPHFNIEQADSCFFFLKEDSLGVYSIATPTSGFAYVSDGKVIATYRHSYHMASVPFDVYENTMKAIFDNYHGQAYDKAYITGLANEYLAKKPAELSDEGAATFFMQHVVMESIYHLRLPGYDAQLITFLKDTANPHNQISAARALHASDTDNAKEALYHVVADTTQPGFLQVMCLLSLKDLHTNKLKKKLEALEKNASDEKVGFGGNIMDPRICTHLPTVKDALKDLLEKK